MSLPEILVAETNALTELTLRSLEGMEGVRVIDARDGIISSALEQAKGPCLVLESGVVVQRHNLVLPPKDVLMKNKAAVCRHYVYADHDTLYMQYETATTKALHEQTGLYNISVCFLNPELWTERPEKNELLIDHSAGEKVTIMPRYMNHKTDICIKTVLSPYDCLRYGVLGNKAACLNYTDILLTGEANVKETYAYLFDVVAAHGDNLLPEDKDRIDELGYKTETRISNFRDELSEIYNVSDSEEYL